MITEDFFLFSVLNLYEKCLFLKPNWLTKSFFCVECIVLRSFQIGFNVISFNRTNTELYAYGRISNFIKRKEIF